MRIPSLFAGLLCLLPSLAQAQTNDQLQALVRKLGSSVYAQREQARKELEAIGPAALDTLRKSATAADAETARRIGDLIRNLEEQLATRKILAPREVHLRLKDATVKEAIDELAKVSEYPIQVLGDWTAFAGKKITLDLKAPFWQALDRLCDESGLMERIDLSVSPSTIYSARVMKNGLRRPVYVPSQESAQAGPIILTNRGNAKSHISHAGSLKTEVRVTRDEKKGELELLFIVSAEPRLVNTGIVGKPILESAVNAQGRRLLEAIDNAKDKKTAQLDPDWPDASSLIEPMRRFTQVRLKDDDEASTKIKELAGKLAFQLDLQNEVLAKIDNVLSSSGKSAAAANGGAMKVIDVRKENDEVTVDVVLENATPNPFGNNVIFNGGGGVIIRGNVGVRGMVIGPGGVRVNSDGGNKDLPELMDNKGQKFRTANVIGDTWNFVNGASTRHAKIQFQANPGQAAPSELVLYGSRTCTIAVPFRFENVPVP